MCLVACRPPAGGGATAPALALNELLAEDRFGSSEAGFSPGDWIELYNPGEADVDLGGWGLSDDPADPWRATLAEGLVVPAGGHLLLLADGDTALGDEHLPFKLDNDGEALTLTAPDGTGVDALTYGTLPPDLSLARAPDGASAWAVSASPTPGAPNPEDPPWDGTDTTGQDPEVLPDVPGDAAERLFRGVLAVDLELDAAALASLEADPYEWVEGAITVLGQRLAPVGVRLKGDTSFQAIDRKPSLKIDLNRFDPALSLYGKDALTFNNMSTDATLLHERLAYAAWRWQRLPAARCGHAFLTLNGRTLGLYAHVETVDEELLESLFDDPSGSLFELWGVDFTDAEVPLFELESGPDDRARLQATADALELAPGPAMDAAAEAVDLAQFLDFWALSAVIGQRDGYPMVEVDDDAHVYDDPARGRLVFLPHGLDEAFSTGDLHDVNGLLAQTCLEVVDCADAWEARVQVHAEALLPADLPTAMRGFAAEIEPYVEADTNMVWEPEAVFTAQGWLEDWLAARPDQLASTLDR